MAKYTVKMSCGHEETVELFGKGKDRERSIEYFEDHGLCKECYKKKISEEKKEQGLIFNASVLPYIDQDDGSILLTVWFSGDTMQHKDEIKSIGGYYWGESEAASNWYSSSRPELCWHKTIKMDEYDAEAEKAISIGAKKVIADNEFFGMAHFNLAKMLQEEWKAKKSKMDEIPKPAIPEILKGHKWNQKIYGIKGKYSIYLDGEKTPIDNEEADQIEQYLSEKEAYQKRIEEIKNTRGA